MSRNLIEEGVKTLVIGALAFAGCGPPTPQSPQVEIRDPAYSDGCFGKTGSLYPKPDSIEENAAQLARTQKIQERLLGTPGLNPSLLIAWERNSDPLSDFLSVVTGAAEPDATIAMKYDIPLTLLRQVEIIRCTGGLSDPSWLQRVNSAVDSYAIVMSAIALEDGATQRGNRIFENPQIFSSAVSMGRVYRQMSRMFYGQHFGEVGAGRHQESTTPPVEEDFDRLDMALGAIDTWSLKMVDYLYGYADTIPTLAPFDQLFPQDYSQEPHSPKELRSMVKADIEDTLAVRGLPTLKTLNQIFP